jgi:hypothetical protein
MVYFSSTRWDKRLAFTNDDTPQDFELAMDDTLGYGVCTRMIA